jgi:TonB family protein
VKNVPVLAGEIAGAESSVPNPEYPANAKSAGTSGRVTVLIRVNGAGGVVIAAHALNGDRQLRVAAEKAARKAKFSPQKLPKQTKVVSGTITYSFAPPHTETTAATGPPAVSSDNALPLIGGALAGAETSVPNAEYPDKAKRKGASSAVMVVVKVNKEGKVINAQALNGDFSLRAAAVKAARRATFSPDKLSDEGKIVSGTITYRFRP